MASGFQSNYNDSGYTPTSTVITGSWYDANNVALSSSISSIDIYHTTQQIGVYMIDGINQRNGGANNNYYKVICSANNSKNIGVPNGFDDAWLVYPGYGFTLYYNTSYSGTTSRNYVNTTSLPVVYYCDDTPNTGWVGQGTPILTTTGLSYAGNQTNSVRIYFRGTEIRVSGIA